MNEKPSILPQGMKLEGSIESDGDFVVLGTVVGEIHLGGALVIEAGGSLTGPARARTIVVRGSLRGDALATETVRIEASARMEGDAIAPKVNVLQGARLRGRIEPTHDGAPRVLRVAKPKKSDASWTVPGTLPAADREKLAPVVEKPKSTTPARTPTPVAHESTLVGAPVAELLPHAELVPKKAVVAPAPKVEATPVPKIEAAPAPKVEATPVPKIETAPLPKIEAAPVPKVAAAPAPKGVVATPVEVRRPPQPRIPAIRRSEAKRREGAS